MFKKTVVYKDYNDKECTEDLYFHMTTPDTMDLQFNPQVGGDMADFVRKMMRDGENEKVWVFFKLLVVNSYGRRSEDGSKFIKRAEFTQDFMDTVAWERFFEWLLLDSPDGKNAGIFWESVMPERLVREAKELEEKSGKSGKKRFEDLSRDELETLFREKMAANSKTSKVIEGSSTEE